MKKIGRFEEKARTYDALARNSKQIFDYPWEGNCNGCNWGAKTVFVLAHDKAEADELLKKGEAGLCGDCFVPVLMEIVRDRPLLFPKVNDGRKWD